MGLFDEKGLSPSLSYNTRADCFDSYVTSINAPKLATHAHCFMIRGLKHKWKQPVSFYFINALTAE